MPPEPAALGRTCGCAVIISAISASEPIWIDPPAADPFAENVTCSVQDAAGRMRHERLGVTVAERKPETVTGSAVYARRNDAARQPRPPGVQPLLALRSAGGRAAPAPARASRSESARPGPDLRLRLAQRPITGMIASGRAQRALQIFRAARLVSGASSKDFFDKIGFLIELQK
jgi:hypothetical protein